MHMLDYELGRMVVAERLAEATEARRRRSWRARQRASLRAVRPRVPTR